MKELLYHYTLGMPPLLSVAAYTGKLKYSSHALQEAASDRYGKIDLPEVFDGRGMIIEAEARGRSSMYPEIIIKQVFRVPYNNEFDLIIVLMPDGTVKTVWLNSKRDKHGTLNKSKYIQYNNNLKMMKK